MSMKKIITIRNKLHKFVKLCNCLCVLILFMLHLQQKQTNII